MDSPGASCNGSCGEEKIEEVPKAPPSSTDLNTRISNMEKIVQQNQVTLERLEATIQENKTTLHTLKLKVEVMDLKNFNLSIEKLGVRRLPAIYGVLQYIHIQHLTEAVCNAIQSNSLQPSLDQQNRYLEFLNTRVFSGGWQQGTYDDLLNAWQHKELKKFTIEEVGWIEHLLLVAERGFLGRAGAPEELTKMSTSDFRCALSDALSIKRTKRTTANRFLSCGDKATRLAVLEDVVKTLSSAGQLNEYSEVVQIMMYGCQLYQENGLVV